MTIYGVGYCSAESVGTDIFTKDEHECRCLGGVSHMGLRMRPPDHDPHLASMVIQRFHTESGAEPGPWGTIAESAH